MTDQEIFDLLDKQPLDAKGCIRVPEDLYYCCQYIFLDIYEKEHGVRPTMGINTRYKGRKIVIDNEVTVRD